MLARSDIRVRVRCYSPLVESVIVVIVAMQLVVLGFVLQHRAADAARAAAERAADEALVSQSTELAPPVTSTVPPIEKSSALSVQSWAVGTPEPVRVNPVA